MPPPSDPATRPSATDPARPVRLSVPAVPRYLSAARVVAASLGAESGLDVDELDDLRLGVNELVALLMEAAGDDGRVDLEFEVADGSVVVRGALAEPGRAIEVDELTRRIVTAVADRHETDGTSFSLTKGPGLRDAR